jgi:hypothetical protein
LKFGWYISGFPKAGILCCRGEVSIFLEKAVCYAQDEDAQGYEKAFSDHSQWQSEAPWCWNEPLGSSHESEA